MDEDYIGSVPKEVDGMSDREILIVTFRETKKNGEQLSNVKNKVSNLDDRVGNAERVTDPINDIFGMAWGHLKKAMSLGVIAVLALLGLGIIWVLAKAKGIWSVVPKMIDKFGG